MANRIAAAPVVVILNPRAGGGTGGRARTRVERELKQREISYRLEETRHQGHAEELARAAAERGAGTIVAAGGDGTIHEVANGILAADAERTQLAVIPIGTGNDFIKAIVDKGETDRFIDAIHSGESRLLDVGHVKWDGGSEYFINGMGTGIDVEVVRQIQRLPHLPGLLGYLAGLLRALVRFRAIPLTLRVDGQELSRRVMIVAVGNGPCLGGGFYLCPNARPDDGELDVCLVRRLSLIGIARVLPRILRGTHEKMSDVEMRRASVIEIEGAEDTPLFFHLDGELREPRPARKVRIEVRERALPVLVPPARTNN